MFDGRCGYIVGRILYFSATKSSRQILFGSFWPVSGNIHRIRRHDGAPRMSAIIAKRVRFTTRNKHSVTCTCLYIRVDDRPGEPSLCVHTTVVGGETGR